MALDICILMEFSCALVSFSIHVIIINSFRKKKTYEQQFMHIYLT